MTAAHDVSSVPRVRRDVPGVLLMCAVFGAVIAGSDVVDTIKDRALLRRIYGERRIHEQGLRIVSYKPLVVSNGDRLTKPGARHHVLSGMAHLVAAVVALATVVVLLPASYRVFFKNPPKRPSITDFGTSLPLVFMLALVPLMCLSRGRPWILAGISAAALIVMRFVPPLTTGRPQPQPTPALQ